MYLKITIGVRDHRRISNYELACEAYSRSVRDLRKSEGYIIVSRDKLYLPGRER